MDMHDLVARFVERANENSKRCQADGNEAMQAIIAGADVVFAIWADPPGSDGFTHSIVKGEGRLMLAGQRWGRTSLDIDAVLVRSSDEAEALRRVYGDGRAEQALREPD